MLKRYFDKQGVLADRDFSEVSETKTEPIYQAWLSLLDPAKPLLRSAESPVHIRSVVRAIARTGSCGGCGVT